MREARHGVERRRILAGAVALLPKDDAGNSAQGDGEVLFEGTGNSLALSDRSHVALVGLDNVVVVASEDAVLVASKDHAEEVKTIVERLKANGNAAALEHARVYRPWGWYQRLARRRPAIR